MERAKKRGPRSVKQEVMTRDGKAEGGVGNPIRRTATLIKTEAERINELELRSDGLEGVAKDYRLQTSEIFNLAQSVLRLRILPLIIRLSGAQREQ